MLIVMKSHASLTEARHVVGRGAESQPLSLYIYVYLTYLYYKTNPPLHRYNLTCVPFEIIF